MQQEIIEGVIAAVRETLALGEGEPISAEQLLFYDLEFSSMDLLDLLFRVEERFNVTIEEGTLYALARGDLADEDFAEDGILTELGRRRLMALLDDTPAEVFPERIHSARLPRYSTVAAIARLVEHRLEVGSTGGDAGADV